MHFVLHSEEQTLRLGEIIGKLLKGKEIICLSGEIGSGKTTLVKGIAKGMGIHENYQVRSPTFTIVNEYPTKKGKLIHIDLYRIGHMDLSEFVGIGAVVIEWGDNLDICECCIVIQILSQKERKFTFKDNCLENTTLFKLKEFQDLGMPDSFSYGHTNMPPSKL